MVNFLTKHSKRMIAWWRHFDKPILLLFALFARCLQGAFRSPCTPISMSASIATAFVPHYLRSPLPRFCYQWHPTNGTPWIDSLSMTFRPGTFLLASTIVWISFEWDFSLTEIELIKFRIQWAEFGGNSRIHISIQIIMKSNMSWVVKVRVKSMSRRKESKSMSQMNRSMNSVINRKYELNREIWIEMRIPPS